MSTRLCRSPSASSSRPVSAIDAEPRPEPRPEPEPDLEGFSPDGWRPSPVTVMGMTNPIQISEITAEDAHELLGTGAFLLDVREDDEWEAGHAAEAVHIAMGLVSERVGEIPTDRTVICVCRMGGRSGAVATALVEGGFDVHNLNGGMTAWEIAGLPVVTDAGATGRII